MIRRRFAVAVVSAVVCAGAVPVTARADPTGMAWNEKKNDGTIDGATIYSALKKPLYVDVQGTTAKSSLTIETTTGTVLGEGKSKTGLTTVTLKYVSGLPDGTYSLIVKETAADGAVSPPIGGLTLIADRVAPARPGLVRFADETLDEMPEIEDDPEQLTITPLVPMILEGSAEPHANVYLVVNGKLKKPNLKTVARDRAGVADAGGAFEAEFEWVNSRRWSVVDGDPVKPYTAKFREGDNDVALVAVDRAGNVSQSSVPLLDFVVVTKQPKTPTRIKPVGLTVRRNGSAWDVGSTRPILMGFSKYSEQDVGLLIDGTLVGVAETDDEGAFFVTPEDPLAVGPHEAQVVTISEEELFSNPSAKIQINVFDGGIDPQLPTDDFNDNVTDLSIWTLVEPVDTEIIAAEEGKKLQFPKVETTARRGVAAGYLSNGWSLDLQNDIVISVKYRFSDKELTGDTGLMLAIVDSLDLVTGEVITGAAAVVGADNGGGYVSLRSYQNKIDQKIEFNRGRPVSDKAYLAYTALTDELFIGDSLDDPGGLTITGLRSLVSDDKVSVYIGSFATGQAPLTKGKDAWMDNFEVEEGVVILDDQGDLLPEDLSAAEPTAERASGPVIDPGRLDLNGDGLISTRDVDLVLQAIGATGQNLLQDVDGDGEVTVRDLRAVLARIGERLEDL